MKSAVAPVAFGVDSIECDPAGFGEVHPVLAMPGLAPPTAIVIGGEMGWLLGRRRVLDPFPKKSINFRFLRFSKFLKKLRLTLLWWNTVPPSLFG